MSRLTVERLFSDPSLSGSVPSQVRIAADGRWVFYLANPEDDRERLDLFGFDVERRERRRLVDASTLVAGGAASDAEQAERERRRQFTRGVSSYAPAPDGRSIAILVDGTIYLHDLADGRLEVVGGEGRHTDLRFSRAGRYLSYVRGGDLYTWDIFRRREQRRTVDGGDTVQNGVAEFIAQEEMHRFDGHWWSADDHWLAFTRVDSASIPETFRYEFGADGLAVVAQRYPRAGGPNAQVRLGVLDAEDGDVRCIDWADAADDYLARAGFAGDRLWVQVQSRDQKRLHLKAFDPATGWSAQTWLEESHSTWINLHDNLQFLPDSTDFVWTSERDGCARAYLYRSGETPVRLTEHGRVNRVVRADATHVYFLGWLEAPIEQHLFRVAYGEGGRTERLTTAHGWHDVAIEPGARWFVDRHANLETPPHVDLVPAAGSSAPAMAIAPNALNDRHPYAAYRESHVQPSFGNIRAEDGQLLWYRLLRPTPFEEGRRYPAIVHVYGGPGVQRVVDDWAPLTLQLFAAAGYAVFELDNRGSGNREKRFEDAIHGRLGEVEVADQLAGVAALRALPWIDPDRIGVFGHSYGGYMALLCLAAGNGAFRSAVSVAPVTDWHLYDTHYTERYLGTPQANPDGYAHSAVFDHLEQLRGDLLLVHGMADDNVLFDHSSRLMLALQRRRIPFELMLYPGAKHALQERDVAIHRYDTILRFFARTL